MREIRGRAEATKKKADQGSAIISKEELEFIKASASIKSKADLTQEFNDNKATKMQSFAGGLARKEKIKETDRARQEAAAKDTSLKKATATAGGSAMLAKAQK